jgi:hypothetical protein
VSPRLLFADAGTEGIANSMLIDRYSRSQAP